MSPTAATFAIGVVAGRGSMAPVVAGAAGVIWSGVKPAGRLMTGAFGSKRPGVAAAALSSGFDAGATASERAAAGLEIACVVFGSSIFGAGSASWLGAASTGSIAGTGAGAGAAIRASDFTAGAFAGGASLNSPSVPSVWKAPSASTIAARLAEGRGVTRDLKLAAKLFEKAAANGVVPAQYRIGNQYEKGLGVTRDLALAKGWYERAAEKGNARAMHNLAVLLAEGGSDRKPDYAAAAESFRKAAEHGVKDSQYNLAVLLARGLGVSQNLARSYTWFAIVAGQGDEDAGRKRDEVGARLSAADLAAAKAAAESFKPATPIREANEVALPANGWPEPVAAPAAKPPASAHRPGGAAKRV